MSKKSVLNEVLDDGQQFRYDAFISYRHLDPDQKIAERLHKLLEAFKLPNKIKARHPGEKTKISRVFRDQEELPLAQNLADPITKALESTEWLIVICSTRLQLSQWCKKEIETFLELRGREYILVALVEGTPEESIPRNLWPKELQDKEQLTEEEAKSLYDVDFRVENEKQFNKIMKEEYLRLAAPMFGEEYHELRDVYMGQQFRKKMTRNIALSLVALLTSIYFIITGIIIHKNNVIINDQYETISYEKSLQYAMKSEEYLDEDDRENAIKNSYYALTNFETEDLSAARKALINALDLYHTGKEFREEYQIDCAGNIEYLYNNDNSEVLVVYDDSRTITGWNFAKKEKAFVINDVHLGPYSAGYTDNGYFGYIDDDSVMIIETATGECTMSVSDINADSLYVNGSDIFVYHDGYVALIDTASKEYDGAYFTLSCRLENNQDYNKIPYVDRDYCFFLGDLGNSHISQAENLGNLTVFAGTSWNEEGVLHAFGPTVKGVDDYHAIGESFLDENGVFNKKIMDVEQFNGQYYVLSSGKDNRAVLDNPGTVTLAGLTQLSVRDIGNKKTYEDTELGNISGKRLIPLVDSAGGEYCLILSDYNGILVSLDYGVVVETEVFSDALVDVFVIDEAKVLCICKDASQIKFEAETSPLDKNIDINFDFKGVSINNILKLDDTHYVASLYESDRVLFYTLTENDLLEHGSDKSKKEKINSVTGENAVKKAEGLGVSEAQAFSSVYELPGEPLILCSSDGGHMVVASTTDGHTVDEWDVGSLESEISFYGKDKEDSFYFACNNHGIVINKMGKLIADIDGVTGVDTGNKLFYIWGKDGKSYKAPIFNLKELLAYTENNYAELIASNDTVQDNTLYELAKADSYVGVVNDINQSVIEEQSSENQSTDWHDLYRNILDELIQSIDVNDSESYGYTYYSLYDINGDNIPEIFVESGTCEADVSIDVLSCNEAGEISEIGMLPVHHTTYYTNPSGTGIYSMYGHMGYFEIDKYEISDGKFTKPESLASVNMDDVSDDPDYVLPDVSDFEPDAKALVMYPVTFSYGIDMYDNGYETNENILSDEEVKDIADEVISGNREIYVVAAKPENIQQKKDVEGTKYLQDIYGKAGLFPYSAGETYVVDTMYHDFNGDGQDECLLIMGEDQYEYRAFVLLSVSDDTVYGYMAGVSATNAEFEIEGDNITAKLSWADAAYTYYFLKDQGFLGEEYSFSE